MEFYKTEQLYTLSKTLAAPLLENTIYPWEALSQISQFILQLGPSLPKDSYTEISEHVWVANSAVIAPSASITGPCIIGPNTEIRHCAFIRGSALIGENAVVGNSTELKNCILFDIVQVPHYNYIGDSILGYKAHMGAGSITSNVKSDKSLVVIKAKDNNIETGIKKVGAFVGDNVEVGCNSVLCPGTILGKNSNVYPTSCVRGFLPANSIFKNNGTIVAKY